MEPTVLKWSINDECFFALGPTQSVGHRHHHQQQEQLFIRLNGPHMSDGRVLLSGTWSERETARPEADHVRHTGRDWWRTSQETGSLLSKFTCFILFVVHLGRDRTLEIAQEFRAKRASQSVRSELRNALSRRDHALAMSWWIDRLRPVVRSDPAELYT